MEIRTKRCDVCHKEMRVPDDSFAGNGWFRVHLSGSSGKLDWLMVHRDGFSEYAATPWDKQATHAADACSEECARAIVDMFFHSRAAKRSPERSTLTQ